VHQINLSWLVRLRWGAILGQSAVIAYTRGSLGILLPLPELGCVLALETLANLGFMAWLSRRPAVSEPAIAASLAIDVCCFTALLYLTGGPMNPFSFLYLVHIALAALVLRQRWAWALVLLSLAANGSLFLAHVPLPMDPHAGHAGHDHHAMHGGAGEPLDMHLRGMWVAFAVAAAFIVYFIHRVTAALRAREAELELARQRSARTEKLAAMATLAAGAAHELGTPLATIAVVAKELERKGLSGEAGADVRLVREQVDRCRDILRQMAGGAGESAGEMVIPARLEEIVEASLEGLPSPERVKPEWEPGARDAKVVVPLHAVAQALRNLIKNGMDATAGAGDVILRVASGQGGCTFEVRDGGAGMSPEVLARAAEPFYTTKEPGKGMGLGLFLSRSVVDLLGGTLDIQSNPGGGTRVVMRLPPAGATKSRMALGRQA
jgi:two-component system sensor histidine kinase RegB